MGRMSKPLIASILVLCGILLVILVLLLFLEIKTEPPKKDIHSNVLSQNYVTTTVYETYITYDQHGHRIIHHRQRIIWPEKNYAPIEPGAIQGPIMPNYAPVPPGPIPSPPKYIVADPVSAS